MPEKDNFSHQYDPKMVYHSYSSNLPHLQSWIDELISLTEQSLPVQNAPSTDVLVQALQRYDSVFKELLRQTSIFSEPVTRMLAKTWTGNLDLMKYMIKSYHRYVRQTSHLQEQAQNLLNEKQREQAASKIQKEEYDLTVTALRARIRNLESEQESLFISKKVLEHENLKLRNIIDSYIHASELNDPVWEIMNNEEVATRAERQVAAANNVGEAATTLSSSLNSYRKNINSAEYVFKELNRLDIELNEVLTNTLKEENRQRLLIKDVMKIITKNKEHLFGAPHSMEEDGNNLSIEKAPLIRLATMGRIPTSIKGQNTKKSFQIGSSFNINLNNPTGASSHYHMEKVDTGIQVDDKDDLGLILDRPEDHVKLDIYHLGVAPLAPANAYFPGLDFPHLLRKRMSSFPTVLRVPTAAWTCQSILSIYLDKIETDRERLMKKLPKLSLPNHIYDYYKNYFGLATAADVQVALLLKACDAHLKRQSRIALFASQIGLLNKENPPNMDVRDTDFILQILMCLMQQGELQSDAQKQSKKRNSAHLSVYIRPDISRQAAINTVYALFEKWLPDGGEDYAIKVKTMQQSDLGIRYVDLDLFIETLIEPWNLVRSTWEDHARFLFKDHSNTFRVLQEALFANDEGVQASDSILVEVQKKSAQDSPRRPLRNFQKQDDEQEGDHNANNVVGSREAVVELMNLKAFTECLQLIDPNIPPKEVEKMFEEALELAHETVLRSLETMWIRYIDSASNYSVTGTQRQQSTKDFIESFAADSFDDNNDLGNSVKPKSAHRVLGTNREFWVNTKTSISQWTRPYYPRIFRCQEIEVDIFIQILIRRDVFPNSPLIEHFNLAPKDLWPNSATFYKQILERNAAHPTKGNK